MGELDGWLIEALRTLPPRQRTSLALRFVEDLDLRAIAERMGCSEGTVKSQLSRGTERLASTLVSTARCGPRVERHDMNDDQQPEDQQLLDAYARLGTALAPPSPSTDRERRGRSCSPGRTGTVEVVRASCDPQPVLERELDTTLGSEVEQGAENLVGSFG